MPTDLEHEQEPLLDELGDRIPDVYPLIHAIRAVGNFFSVLYTDLLLLTLLLLAGHDSKRPFAYNYNYTYYNCYHIHQQHYIGE